jgi:NADH-quinone oxidoreductase subunit M
MLKLGFYGLVKFCFGFFSKSLFFVAAPILTFAFIGAIVAGFSTYNQLDLKKIIAYSSVAHMNMAIFGYFVLSGTAFQAALFINLSHAIVSAGLFSLVGVLQDRVKTRNLAEISGLSTVMPV